MSTQNPTLRFLVLCPPGAGRRWRGRSVVVTSRAHPGRGDPARRLGRGVDSGGRPRQYVRPPPGGSQRRPHGGCTTGGSDVISTHTHHHQRSDSGFRPQRTHLYRFIQLAIFSHHKNFIPINSLTYGDQ